MESKINPKTASTEDIAGSSDLQEPLDDFFVDLEIEPFSPDKLDVKTVGAESQPAIVAPLSNNAVFEYEGPGEALEPDASALHPEQAEALLMISGLLNSDLNPGRVLGDMLKPIRALFHADRAAVFLRQNLPLALTQNLDSKVVDEEDKTEIGPIVCAAALGLSPVYINQIINFYETKEFRRLQRVRRPVYVADAQHDYRLNGVRELNRREGFQTMLTLPLLHRQMLIGLLVLYHDQKHPYSIQEIKLLNIFANQAALAISNARLYHETRKREREAAILAQASRSFNSSLKLREVLNHVVRAATNVLGNTALVFILREGSTEAHPVAYYCKTDNTNQNWIKTPSPVRTQPPIRLGEGAIGKTIQSGVPFYIRNPKDVLKAAPFVRSDDNVQSLLCVPLKMRGRAIGALISYNIQPTYSNESKATSKVQRGVSPQQVSLAQALADRAAVAIDNARTYEAEKREQQAKDEFLSFVAHELRTPLTSIKGFNHLLGKKLQEPSSQLQADPQAYLNSLKHYSDVMDTQAQRLYNLIQDLSSISLIENGRLEMQLQLVNLVELVHATIDGFQADLKATEKAHPTYEINFRPNRPVIELQLDPEATNRSLRNLLSNAVKFSPKGGEILVRVTQTSSEAVVIVQDFGIGIRSQDQEHVFERFYKANSLQGRANGLGMGLYITKNLIEAEGGHITVKSEEGVGSTFTISFPLPPKKA